MAMTKRNGYFNDPAMGQAFGNLADVFAPPSASEVYAYAKAGETKQKMQHLADLFSQAGNPNMTPEELSAFDQRNIAAGNYNWSGSRYNTDLDAKTSVTNNTADNARALQQTGITERGATTREMLKPVIVGEGQTALIPQQTQDFAGLPDMFVGAVKTAPGDTVTLPTRDGGTAPGNPVIKGVDKPLTEEQLKAQILGKLPEAEQRAVVTAGAVDKGVLNYTGPNGETGTARAGVDGKMIDTQTGAPLTAGSKIFSAAATGTPDQFGGKTTEAQDRSAYAVTMAEGATNDVLSAFDKNELPNGTDFQAFNAMGGLPANFHPALVSMMTPQGQKFYQNVRSALPYQLMSQSGQAVTEQEYERKLGELVPVPGEDSTVTLAKRRQFETYVKAARGVAGPAYKKIHGPDNVPGTPASTPSPSPSGGVAPAAATPAAPKPVNWKVVDGKLVQVQ